MVLRFDDLGMQHRMDAIGEIIMEQGYPTILCLQASQSIIPANLKTVSATHFVAAALLVYACL